MPTDEPDSVSEQLEQWRKQQRDKIPKEIRAVREGGHPRDSLGLYSSASEVILCLAQAIALIGVVVSMISVPLYFIGNTLGTLSALAASVSSFAFFIVIGRSRDRKQ